MQSSIFGVLTHYLDQTIDFLLTYYLLSKDKIAVKNLKSSVLPAVLNIVIKAAFEHMVLWK